MMSPTPAKRRFDPPSTLMHWTRLAPLLSATSRFDCIWIIDALPFQLAFRGRPGVPLIVTPAASGVLCVSMRYTTFQLFSLEIGDRKSAVEEKSWAERVE